MKKVTDDKVKLRKDPKISREARTACEKWMDHFSANIDRYHQMHSFVLGNQWDKDEETMLIGNKKKPLTSNKLAAMSNILIGEQQKNTPQLEVIPMTNCDYETARLRELITKDIMFSNNAKLVYDTAAKQAYIGGFGAYLIDTEYAHSRSFDTDIRYRYFKDSTMCYWDLGCETKNKIDGMHSGFKTRLTREKFRHTFGKDIEKEITEDSGIKATKQEIEMATDTSQKTNAFLWSDNDTITIIDHYKRIIKKEMIYKLSDGSSANQEELDEIIEKSIQLQTQRAMQMQEQQYGEEPQMPMQQEQEYGDDRVTLYKNGQPIRIDDQREKPISTIIHYKIAGEFILEKEEFPSEDLPLIFVDQASFYDKTGKQICPSFFDYVVDTQKYINYIRTQSAYVLKVSRYDQWIGSKANAQSADTQRNWQDPSDIKGLLTYDESPNGNKPEQIRPPELSQSLLSQYQLALDDLYSGTGLYPAKMGENTNDSSGVAIDARTRQGSLSTSPSRASIDNAIEAGGQVVNQMIPRVYDAERVISLMSSDEGVKNITINKQSDEYGELIENDIRKGTYQVRLKPGASYEGQKEEARISLEQTLKANPQAFNLIADLWADSLPLANNIELKNRLKTLVPPEIIEAGKTGKMPEPKPQQPTPEQIELQMKQQEMQQNFALKKEELDLKKQQMQIDLQIEAEKLEAERVAAMAEIKESEFRYMAETGRTESDESIAHANNLVKILTHKISQ